MRDILFRAKEISTDKWVEGYLVKISEDDYRIATEEDINWAYTKLGDYDGVMTCVNPETICQYTGLTDKNGNKIWENDVVKHYNKVGIGEPDKYLIASIRWEHNNVRFIQDTEDGKYSIIGSCNFEVIGNIFDGEFQNDSEGTKKD